MSNQASQNNSSHSNSPNQTTGLRRRCRSAQGRTDLKNTLLNQARVGEPDATQLQLGAAVKKFVETKTGEVIYLKQTGEAFYQKTKSDVLVLISDLKQLVINDSPMSISSLNPPAPDTTGQGKYNGASFPVPLNPIHKKYDQEAQKQSGFQSSKSWQKGAQPSSQMAMPKSSPANQSIFRSSSNGSLFGLGTPRLEQFSPNSFLITSNPQGAGGA